MITAMTKVAEQMIAYEQPLNENIRMCLRLEHVLQQAHDNLTNVNAWNSRTALIAILHAMSIIERPDLKTKLTKMLTEYSHSLNALEGRPGVDQDKLETILKDLDRLVDGFYGNHGRIGKELTENEFLTTIRQHFRNPGGAVAFSTPAYNLWLNQPAEQRQQDLQRWLVQFNELQQVVELILKITRNSRVSSQLVAEGGFYQDSLDAKAPYSLVRVELPKPTYYYPEISVGRHGVSIRFFELDLNDSTRDRQTKDDVEFKMHLCGI